jgi:hypothetical protein
MTPGHSIDLNYLPRSERPFSPLVACVSLSQEVHSLVTSPGLLSGHNFNLISISRYQCGRVCSLTFLFAAMLLVTYTKRNNLQLHNDWHLVLLFLEFHENTSNSWRLSTQQTRISLFSFRQKPLHLFYKTLHARTHKINNLCSLHVTVKCLILIFREEDSYSILKYTKIDE